MSVAAPSAPAARGPIRSRLRAVPALASARVPAVALGALVGASALVQTALAWARPTPGYFPDEYLYAALGRSLAEGAGPLVRGGDAHFLPILYPLLSAPGWLFDEVATGYRAVQGLNALAMSLAAVPVFLLARRLQLGDRLALACAALAVAAPTLLYSSWVMAEALAYPLALTTVACAVALLDRPSPRLQLAFLGLAGLAGFTRVQLAALPLCYLAAVVAVGLRERRLRAVLAEQRLAAGVLGSALVLAVGAGLRGHFGYYPSFTYVQVAPLDALQGLGANALVLAYSLGWALVPAALLGVVLALVRARSTAELALGALTATLVPLLLLQASLYGDTANVQERYVIYATPLLVLAFASYARRGWPLLRAHALLAAALAACAALVPLAGYAAAQGSAQSLLLSAHQGIALALSDLGLASLALALGATAVSALVLGAAWRLPHRATAVACAATLVAFGALTTAAFSYYQAKRTSLLAELLPDDPSWVDHAGAGDVALLLSPRGARADSHTTLFWNRSVTRVLLAPNAESPDVFAAAEAAVDGAGRLRVGGAPVRGPVLLDVYGTSIVPRGGRVLGSSPTKALWRPDGPAQLRLALVGRYYDGWLAADGLLQAWPERAGGRLDGRLELQLEVPRGATATTFTVELPDGRTLRRRLAPGSAETVRIPVCGAGAWKAEYSVGATAIVHGARVGAVAGEPQLVDDPSACA